ncbi:MAG: hypothetical protein AB7S26_23510 [Sandaracinaceae bacterium]
MSESFVSRVTAMVRDSALGELNIHDGVVRITVPRTETETVHVYVRPCGEMHGKEVLEFSSAGLALPSDDANKMPLLILALQRNADVMLGHWGLDETEEGSLLRVFHSQITETMDLPELRGAVLGVADEYATLANAFRDILAP